MKIALILTPWHRRESPAPEFAMTTSLLKKEGHSVYVYDINNAIFNDKFLLRKYWRYFILDAPQNIENEFFDLTKDIFQYYAYQILSLDADVVIFKIINKEYSNSIEMAKVIKEIDKDKIIIFSSVLLINRDELELIINRQDSEPFDYIICGEDEIALPKLIYSLENKTEFNLNLKGKVIDCMMGPKVEDLDTLPYYEFSVFKLDTYKFSDKLEMFISKGCPWSCSFCVDWITEKTHRAMSGKRIYEEVQYQHNLHKTKHFRFCDKTINGNIKSLSDFCNLMLKGCNNASSSIHWSGDAMIRPEMTKELLLTMRRAGCMGIGYGLESGSEKIINDMHKRFSITLAEEVIRNTHNADIFTSINIIVGFPTETDIDFQNTLNFIEINKAFIDEVRLTYVGCRILKDSTLYKFPHRFNLSSLDPDFWTTMDGLNIYEERVKRYEIICRHILKLGIALRVNSRVAKKVAEIN